MGSRDLQPQPCYRAPSASPALRRRLARPCWQAARQRRIQPLAVGLLLVLAAGPPRRALSISLSWLRGAESPSPLPDSNKCSFIPEKVSSQVLMPIVVRAANKPLAEKAPNPLTSRRCFTHPAHPTCPRTSASLGLLHRHLRVAAQVDHATQTSKRVLAVQAFSVRSSRPVLRCSGFQSFYQASPRCKAVGKASTA